MSCKISGPNRKMKRKDTCPVILRGMAHEDATTGNVRQTFPYHFFDECFDTHALSVACTWGARLVSGFRQKLGRDEVGPFLPAQRAEPAYPNGCTTALSTLGECWRGAPPPRPPESARLWLLRLPVMFRLTFILCSFDKLGRTTQAGKLARQKKFFCASRM